MRETYIWKKKPYAHQVAAVKKLLKSGWGGALLMQPRTGKTKVVIDYASIQFLKGRISRVLVFCPLGVISVWEDQIRENCPVPYRILIWDRKARKAQELPKFGKPILDFVIINYDALSTPGLARRNRKTGEVIRKDDKLVRSRRGGRYEVRAKLANWQPDLVVLDESHRIKSPSSRKSYAIHRFNEAPYRVIATGTPITKAKRVFDIYSQWKFLNPSRFGGLDFGDFKTEYGRWVDMGNWKKWKGNKNEARLHSLVHRDSFAITRAECFDLPKSTPQFIHIDLEESAETYDKMAADMVAKIQTGEITEASIQLVLGTRLAQITGGFTRTLPTDEHPKGRFAIIGSEKLRVWEDRIEDLMEAEEKVVVGAEYVVDINRLREVCERRKIPVYVVRGGLTRQEREQRRLKFWKEKAGAVFIGQPAAASEGIDLSCASILQWYSLPRSWVNYTQFTDRIALSSRPTFYEFFLARGTIDEIKYNALQEDGQIGKQILLRPELLTRSENKLLASMKMESL